MRVHRSNPEEQVFLAQSSDAAVYYDRLSRWGEPMSDADQERIKRTLELIPEDTRTVLDVGCGDGALTNLLLQRGLVVTGLDFSRTALQHVAGPRVVGAVDALPFADRSFDLVLCAEVLEHLPEHAFAAARAEIERVAARWIVVSTPNDEYLPARLAKCIYCHTKFHANRHVRSFNRAAHQQLFPDFVCDLTADICTWRHDPLMIAIQQRLFDLYAYKQDLVCPCCGRQGVVPARRGLPSRALLKAMWWVRKLGPEPVKPRWIASRFTRTAGHPA